jgi:outer membrane protein assembly factor BamB
MKSFRPFPGFAFALMFLVIAEPQLRAADWPQYRGPGHDGFSADRIQKQWPETGPREVWRVACTNGLSSFAIAGGMAFTQIRRDSGTTRREYCVALDLETGSELWAAPIGPSPYDTGSVGPDDGPRATPTVENGRVYIVSSFLVVHCLDATNGASVWSKDLKTLYGGRDINWNSAASALLDGGLIFVNCNSSANSLLALRTTDGSLAWRSQTEAMTHATPVAATIEGRRQVIFATQSGLVSVAPADGALLWKARYPFTYSTSLAASPVVHSNIVFISAAYSMGSFATRIGLANNAWTATPIWTNRTFNYKAHWMSPVAHQGYLYGLFGSDPTARLNCIDLSNGTLMWSEYGFGRGGTLLVDNTVMALSEMGDLILVSTNTTAYTEIARRNVFNYDPNANRCWNAPAVANGRVYARSTGEAVCLDIAIPPVKMLEPLLVGGMLQLRIAAANGTPLDNSRMTALQVRYADDLSAPYGSWSALPGPLRLNNGIVEATDPDAGSGPRFYMISEVP